MTIEEFLEAGERIQNLRQAFNVREGFLPSSINRRAPLVAAAAAVPVVNPVRSFLFIGY